MSEAERPLGDQWRTGRAAVESGERDAEVSARAGPPVSARPGLPALARPGPPASAPLTPAPAASSAKATHQTTRPRTLCLVVHPSDHVVIPLRDHAPLHLQARREVSVLHGEVVRDQL